MGFIIRLHYISVISTVLLPLAFYDYVVFCQDKVNHIGISPYILLLIFLPVGYYSFSKSKIDGRKWIIPILLAFFGILNIVFLDAADVMKSKTSWLDAGMPDRPAWSQLDICE
jgi:hypothetical protein